jgi:Right handed beta helix region
MFRTILATIPFLLFASQAPAQLSSAAYSQTFVSRAGDDGNNLCGSRTAPCATIVNAAAFTGIGGVVSCVDRNGFDYGFTINKSIFIDCPGAIIQGNISINLTTASDPQQSVRIRGLVFNGQNGTQKAIVISKAGTVILENLVVDGFSDAGILDIRTAPGRLIIQNSFIRQVGGVGIGIAATGGTNVAMLDNVTSTNNTFGLAVGNGNNVSISRSTFAQNTRTGIEADFGGRIGIDGSTIAENLVNGLENYGTMAISNSDLRFNQTAVTGTVNSFGNNRLFGNGSTGSAFTGGAASTDRGQQ